MLLSSLHITPSLPLIPEGKALILTVNAWSFVVAQKDAEFAAALQGPDALLPDGKSVVWASKFLGLPDSPKERIAGWDLFVFEMDRLQAEASASGRKRRVMFLGSSPRVLQLITERAARDYPMLEVITFSPPYKSEFSAAENAEMISAVNAAAPDLLWIGMTAPKQEKWLAAHWDELAVGCHCGAIGAVFDFYAGTVKRAPLWMQKAGLEWLHRLCSNPRRLMRRYLGGNFRFIILMIKEKLHI